MTMVHLSDVVVMKVSNTVLKHKHAARNTLARNRMLARLTEAAEQDVLLATHDNAELMWLRRHVGTDDIAEPEPYLFCFQHDWDVLTPAERALRTIKGLTEFHPDWAFWGYDAALLWGLEVPNDLLGPRFLVKTGCSVTLSSGCRLLRPQAAGALEQVDGVRVTSFWRTVEDCLLRAPFSYGLAIADSALRAKGVSRWDLFERLRADCEGRRGYRRAQVIASHADGLSENGGESRFRAFFIAYGFPVPELQVEFRDPLDPSQVFRVDYFWRLEDGTCVIGELDGRGKYTLQDDGDRESVDPFVAERQRESHLTMLGHKVLRFTFNELKDPGKLVEKMRLAGIPRRPDLAEEWRRQWYGR
ncbi:hypothetical protein AAAX75_04925 [Collinsella sp. CLA-ER-H7]|uniref:hypothetical protein n=1 Tax=Collinsella sp. CLA-ER-H7 TaxID=3136230 RepID=UPI0032BF3837